MTDAVLKLSHITKRFGALVANNDISLQLKAGEVLALLGENGAGKSTLVSILFGHYTADAGHIEAFGKTLPPGDPKAALAAGIGMVHQHFTLADNLSVLDNVMMGTEPLWQPFTRQRAARAKLIDVARRFGLGVDPSATVGKLSVGERQRVEILKALYRDARILILDEPTAVLTPPESEVLFQVLAQMVAQGLSIIFISHKLGEVLRVSTRIAVLRGGQLVAESDAKQTTQAQLAQWMVGHEISAPQRRPATSVGDPVCVLNNVSTAAGRGRLNKVSLTLRSGEIVAIAGVSGNGQVALAELLCGTRHASAGRVEFMGRDWPARPAQLVAQGVARIPEDRQAVGTVGDLPVWENAVSERLRSAYFSRFSWVRRRAARAYAERVIEAFDVRGGGAFAPTRSLSGGNMQKLILGRALLHPDRNTSNEKTTTPKLIIAHQPTWGLDIGAVAYVQQQLIAARDAGAAVLLISDDLDEVLTLGDRVAVMHDGHLSEARPTLAWSREAIGLAMAGVGSSEAKSAHFPDEPPLGKIAPSGSNALHDVKGVGANQA